MPYSQKTIQEILNNPDDERHGTLTGYRVGCRCDRCKKAGNESRKKYRDVLKQVGGKKIKPDRSRQDDEYWETRYKRWQKERAIELLNKPYALTTEQIAERVGVNPSTVVKWGKEALKAATGKDTGEVMK